MDIIPQISHVMHTLADDVRKQHNDPALGEDEQTPAATDHGQVLTGAHGLMKISLMRMRSNVDSPKKVH